MSTIGGAKRLCRCKGQGGASMILVCVVHGVHNPNRAFLHFPSRFSLFPTVLTHLEVTLNPESVTKGRQIVLTVVYLSNYAPEMQFANPDQLPVIGHQPIGHIASEQSPSNSFGSLTVLI